jgi:hypothetical protein
MRDRIPKQHDHHARTLGRVKAVARMLASGQIDTDQRGWGYASHVVHGDPDARIREGATGI